MSRVAGRNGSIEEGDDVSAHESVALEDALVSAYCWQPTRMQRLTPADLDEIQWPPVASFAPAQSMHTVWVDASGDGIPEDAPATPHRVIREVGELVSLGLRPAAAVTSRRRPAMWVSPLGKGMEAGAAVSKPRSQCAVLPDVGHQSKPRSRRV
jgi:hypothetical protein